MSDEFAVSIRGSGPESDRLAFVAWLLDGAAQHREIIDTFEVVPGVDPPTSLRQLTDDEIEDMAEHDRHAAESAERARVAQEATGDPMAGLDVRSRDQAPNI